MISKAAASLPTAAAMDEAIAGFDITDAKSSRNSVRVSGQLDERRPMKDSLMTSLAAQLEALDQQRQHLFELLQSIEE